MKCEHCIHCGRGVDNMKYCTLNQYYPDKTFIECWGCNDFKEKYLNLLEQGKEEE